MKTTRVELCKDNKYFYLRLDNAQALWFLEMWEKGASIVLPDVDKTEGYNLANFDSFRFIE